MNTEHDGSAPTMGQAPGRTKLFILVAMSILLGVQLGKGFIHPAGTVASTLPPPELVPSGRVLEVDSMSTAAHTGSGIPVMDMGALCHALSGNAGRLPAGCATQKGKSGDRLDAQSSK